MTVSNNTSECCTKRNASQLSLWDASTEEESQDNESRQQDLIQYLKEWAILNGHPELEGVRAGRSNWTPENWDLERLEAVDQAADLFSQRQRADFALSHWAIEHAHPCIFYRSGDETKQIEAGLTSWVAWCKGASLEELHMALKEVTR